MNHDFSNNPQSSLVTTSTLTIPSGKYALVNVDDATNLVVNSQNWYANYVGHNSDVISATKPAGSFYFKTGDVLSFSSGFLSYSLYNNIS
jgi:hypothetical protein